jgi:thiamine biosynthesis lipoprotein ApbE
VFFGGDVRTLGPVRINGGEVVSYGAVATSVKSRDILAKKPGYPEKIVSVWAPTCAEADALATAILAGFF